MLANLQMITARGVGWSKYLSKNEWTWFEIFEKMDFGLVNYDFFGYSLGQVNSAMNWLIPAAYAKARSAGQSPNIRNMFILHLVGH